MAPKIEWPSASSISMRDRVAELQERRLRRAGIDRLDGARSRRCRNSRRRPRAIGLPGPPSRLFDTVPEPMMVPATSGRVLAAWAISVGKSKVMSTPASARPKGLPLSCDQQRQMQLAAVPGVAQLVRRDRDRREGRRGLRLEEAEALGEFGRDQVAQRHVVDQHDEPDRCTRLVAARAHRHVVDDDRDLGLEIDAPGLVGHAGSGRAAPRKPSEPPWYISGSVQKLAGISAPRALRTSSTWFT